MLSSVLRLVSTPI